MTPSQLDERRAFFAKMMAAASQSLDPRLERIFEMIPREAFLGPPPWRIMVGDQYVATPNADPSYLYQNCLVALNASRGVNNGEPFLHARWIGAAAPSPGETVTHIGVGGGYYTAILSMLIRPGGTLRGYEIDPELTAAAARNLEAFDNVVAVAEDATAVQIAPTDLIYVSAGMAAPPLCWLEALKPGGRMVFPWRPAPSVGIGLLLTRGAQGFGLTPLGPAFFIPCLGAAQAGDAPPYPAAEDAWAARALHLRRDRAPGADAVAEYQDLWFSRAPLGSDHRNA